jgi:Zn-dependent peptidase ImmA (M78 family)/DNA-binding XRE family transcriptional regulator
MDDRRRLLGDRVRKARERLGLKQKQLADEAGFPSLQTISQIEKGDRDVKAWELFNLAKALRLELSELLSVESPDSSVPVVWRKVPTANRELIEADFRQHCKDYAFLEELCNLKAENELPIKDFDLSRMSYQRATKFGDEIREELNLGNRPASCLSGTLEEKYAVKIWYANLGDECSAASAKGSFGSGVLINADEPPWRRNFSFAHELFHLLTWPYTNQTSISGVGFSDRIEKIAESFASSLLLPGDEVNRILKERETRDAILYIDLVEISREFDVSAKALLWRMVNLGYINSDKAQEILADPEFTKKDHGARIGAWGHPPDVPERFARLAHLAYRKGKLSRARLAQLLNVSLIDLTDRLLEYGLDDSENYQGSVRTSRRSRNNSKP